ncbi:MAG TPA: hypothetical protein PLZ56_13620, partial [Anaerolineae bacterium]|nr:hypothetical protein [Anaerolineae bacterium]
SYPPSSPRPLRRCGPWSARQKAIPMRLPQIRPLSAPAVARASTALASIALLGVLLATLRLMPAKGRELRTLRHATSGPLAGSPDLAVSRVSHGGVAGDWQNLVVDGSLTANIVNRGDAPTGSPFRVTFFSDDDGDQQLSPGTDTVLGQSDVAALDAESTVTVTQKLQGSVRFRDDLVYAMATAPTRWPSPKRATTWPIPARPAPTGPPSATSTPCWNGSGPAARRPLVRARS